MTGGIAVGKREVNASEAIMPRLNARGLAFVELLILIQVIAIRGDDIAMGLSFKQDFQLVCKLAGAGLVFRLNLFFHTDPHF